MRKINTRVNTNTLKNTSLQLQSICTYVAFSDIGTSTIDTLYKFVFIFQK